MAPLLSSYVLHRLIYGKHGEIFLFETTKPRALLFDIKHHLVNFYQVYSNNAPRAKTGPVAGFKEAYIKSTVSEYCHVAYQFKGNEAYNYMLANISPLYTHTIDPWGGVKRSFFFFSESRHVHIKLRGMKHRTPC